MKIFITGATGFIGRYIVNKLLECKNIYIVVPTRNIDKGKRLFNKENIKFIYFQEDLEHLVKKEKPDIVINLLGILTENRKKGIIYEKVHYEYTKRLVEGAVSSGVSKFLQMSALGASVDAESRYHKTKALAEEVVISSGLNFAIFKPSIIIGKGQKLFEDFKKLSKISPFFFAPTGKVQPIHIYDVRDIFIKNIFEDFENKIWSLCGERIVSYKELFEFALKYIGVNRKVIQVPNWFFIPLLPIFELLPNPPLTKEQYLMLKKDNVCNGENEITKKVLVKLRDPFDI